jgi:predicted O-methyltransferase YrrM
MLLGKLESAVWFLKRPQLFPQFVHLVRQRIFGGRVPDTRAQSVRWCERRAIGIEDAITRLTGAKMDLPLAEKCSEVFAEAKARAEKCPVTMGGPGALDLLYWTIARKKSLRAVETGVAYGWSSLAILLAQRESAGSRLVSIDMPYLRANNDAYVGIAIPERFKTADRWELIRRSDRQALPGALRRLGQIDFCHYDSDKTYGGRMWAYPRLWRALSGGGIFISDDIGDDVGFRDFSEMVGAEPVVVRIDQEGGPKYVGILVKPAAAS